MTQRVLINGRWYPTENHSFYSDRPVWSTATLAAALVTLFVTGFVGAILPAMFGFPGFFAWLMLTLSSGFIGAEVQLHCVSEPDK